MTAGVERAPARVATPTLEELRRLAAAAVVCSLDGASTCAYLDWPAHGNVGDSALWLAGLQALGEASVRVAYTASEGNFDPAALRRLHPDGPVLIAAGGNLGDLWPVHQRFRERVLAELPERHVIQLAQSIHFETKAALDRARSAFRAHPNLTLLVRDHPSRERSRESLGVEPVLTPDLAFALGPLGRTRPPEVDVLWLARTDKESAHSPPPGASVEVVDWLRPDPPRGGLAARLEARARRTAPLLRGRIAATLENGFRAREQEALSRARLAFGIDLLCRASVVVTDRLHAHVLCCLLGIPHVLLDNSYGKVIALHETWTQGLGLTRVAGDATEALVLAQELVA